MIRINLLPIKAAQRQVSARNELFAMIGLIGLAVVGLYVWYSSVDSEIDQMRSRTTVIDRDLVKLTEEVKQVEGLKNNEKKVMQKLEVINRLLINKTGPARMLYEIASIMTSESKRVWLIKLSQKGDGFTLTGGAMDHEDISEFQLALERRDTFANVKLKRITTETVKADTPTYLTWGLTCTTQFKAQG